MNLNKIFPFLTWIHELKDPKILRADMIAGTGDDDIFLQSATIVPRLSQVFDLSPSDMSALSNLVAEGKFSTKSENFMIRSVGQLNHKKGRTTIVAVAERTGQIKYWREEI